ncbi:universal stress protein [Yoonia sp. R2331]|uniref:universal stress protein n=1 Tax=Yoonia sp. R2331 TaxID=3237238 RepID=UPI0034E5E74E
MFKTVLIAVDVSVRDDATRLLTAASTLTASWDCTLHVVTVIPNVGMAIVGSFLNDTFEADSQTAAKAELASLIAAQGITAQDHVLSGRVYDSVISQADAVGADLILVGAHQPDFGDYLLGANAARIVRHAHQSVMVLRDGA